MGVFLRFGKYLKRCGESYGHQTGMSVHQNDFLKNELFIFFHLEENETKEDTRAPLTPARTKGCFNRSPNHSYPFPVTT
jgi:hypothetical protein